MKVHEWLDYAARENPEREYATQGSRTLTYGDAKRTVESYLVDYHGNLYGAELRLDIVARLRDEKKFASAEALKKQMAEDVREGKIILKLAGDN